MKYALSHLMNFMFCFHLLSLLHCIQCQPFVPSISEDSEIRPDHVHKTSLSDEYGDDMSISSIKSVHRIMKLKIVERK